MPVDEISYAGSLGLNSWSTYVPTYTGFSAPPADPAYYLIVDKICFISHCQGSINPGTSNATTFTLTMPPGISLPGVIFAPCRTLNNGVTGTDSGLIQASDTTIYAFRDWGGLAWTASGSKHAEFVIWFEFA